jgi:hypothetical protein
VQQNRKEPLYRRKVKQIGKVEQTGEPWCWEEDQVQNRMGEDKVWPLRVCTEQDELN